MASVIQRRVVILLFLLTLVLTGVNGDKKEEKEQDPSLVERAIGFTDVVSRLQSVNSWIKLAWINLRSPDSRYRKGGLMKEQARTPIEWAIGIPHFGNRWDATRAWIKFAFSGLPSLDTSDANAETTKSSNPGEVMKEAATKSFKTSKETVEHAAASAAKVAGEAVEKTKKKMKKTAYVESEL